MSQPTEKALLAAILRSEQTYYEVEGRIDEAMFYDVENARIYAAVCDLYRRDMQVSINLVIGELAKVKMPISDDYVYELFQHSYPINVDDAVRWLYNRWACDELRGMIARDLPEMTAEIDDYSEAIDNIIDRVNSLRAGHLMRAQDIGDVAETTIERIAEARHNKIVLGVPIGFPTFDEATGGLSEGNVVMIGGKPGSGKTTTSMTICFNVVKEGMPVGFVSAEMTAPDLSILYLALLTGIDTEDIRSGRISDEEEEKLRKAREGMRQVPIYVIDKIQTLADAKGAITTLHAKHGVGLVVVDYMQIIRVPGVKKVEAVGTVGTDLTAHCKRLGVRGVFLSQRSKDGSLKWSSDLEQDADIIAMLEYPGKDDVRYGGDVRVLDIVKNRLGTETFKVYCRAAGRRICEDDGVRDDLPGDALDEIEELPF